MKLSGDIFCAECKNSWQVNKRWGFKYTQSNKVVTFILTVCGPFDRTLYVCNQVNYVNKPVKWTIIDLFVLYLCAILCEEVGLIAWTDSFLTNERLRCPPTANREAAQLNYRQCPGPGGVVSELIRHLVYFGLSYGKWEWAGGKSRMTSTNRFISFSVNIRNNQGSIIRVFPSQTNIL